METAKQQSSAPSKNTSNTTCIATEMDIAIDILEIPEQEQRLWQDSLNEENLEDVRHTPQLFQEIDREMMCDIEQLVGRLIAKSEQLLGK